MKKLTTALASLLLFISNSSIAQMPVTDEAANKQLAQEIAHCYMSHLMSFGIADISRNTDKYLLTMVDLAGEDNLRLLLNIAKRRYEPPVNGFATRNPNLEMARTCPVVDSKIEKLLN